MCTISQMMSIFQLVIENRPIMIDAIIIGNTKTMTKTQIGNDTSSGKNRPADFWGNRFPKLPQHSEKVSTNNDTIQ